MRAPECPMCHKRASMAGQTPYCIQCGWNRDVAIAALRRNIKVLPFGIALFAGFFVFLFYGWHFRHPEQLAFFVTAPAIGLLTNYFAYRRQLAKLEALPPSASGADPTASQAASIGGDSSQNKYPFMGSVVRSAPRMQPDPKHQALLSVPRPRQIRTATRGRLNIAIIFIVVTGLAAFLVIYAFDALSPAPTVPGFSVKYWVFAGFAALILLVPFAMWRIQLRECDLLQNGEIAMGRVTGQWLNKGNSSISYEFTDFRGDTHRGSGSDYSKKLYSGMPVTVFYDTNNPKRQIAYCSAFHEIVL
jgi:hypothetical protein